MLVGVYGASGFSREVLPILRRAGSDIDEVVFIGEAATNKSINGCDALDWDGFLSLDGKKSAVIAIADAAVRENLDVPSGETWAGNPARPLKAQ